MALFEGFPPGCLPFLKQLAKHNDRAWFNDNKQRYESDVRMPALAFIEAMAPTLKRLSPHFRAIPKKVGGSLMRPYRDTRFANDKTPFKTNVGIQFRHELGADVHAPGWYLHIEPGNCFLGAGIWHPEPPVLHAIRDFIVDNPRAWKAATQASAFARDWALVGETLTRPPRGYAPDHALLVDLKRKDFIACMNFDDAEIMRPDFIQYVAKSYKRAVPLMSYLCMAVEADF